MNVKTALIIFGIALLILDLYLIKKGWHNW